jgi:hypothetical protein
MRRGTVEDGVSFDCVGASKTTRPAPALSVGLVRFVSCETTRFEGTPLEHPAHGLRPYEPCFNVELVRFVFYQGLS